VRQIALPNQGVLPQIGGENGVLEVHPGGGEGVEGESATTGRAEGYEEGL
jgi:hypothetical protein